MALRCVYIRNFAASEVMSDEWISELPWKLGIKDYWFI